MSIYVIFVMVTCLLVSVKEDAVKGGGWLGIWQHAWPRSLSGKQPGGFRDSPSSYPRGWARAALFKTYDQRRAGGSSWRTRLEEVPFSPGSAFLVRLANHIEHCYHRDHTNPTARGWAPALVAEGALLPSTASPVPGCREHRVRSYKQWVAAH